MKAPKTTIVSRVESQEEYFKPPGKYYYVDAFFNLVFIHKAKREDAQAWIDFIHGKGKYKIRVGKLAVQEKLP